MSEPRPIDDTHVGLLDVDEVVDETVTLEGSNRGAEVERGAFRKLASAVAVLAVGIAATYTVPGLHWAQPWSADDDYVPFWNLVGRELMGQGAVAAKAQDTAERFGDLARELDDKVTATPIPPPPRKPAPPPKQDDTYPAYQAHPDDAKAPEQPLENAEAIASFYRALTHTELGLDAKVTRVSHWGDSVLGNDGITAAIRHHLQARFGDAGHGFHALTQYDPSYRHKGITFRERSPWSKCYIINRCMKSDGRYGYGGTTVWSAGGAESVFGTVDDGFGSAVSTFELWYLAWPRGGKLQVRVDKGEPTIIEAHADEPQDRWQTFTVEDGAHEFSVRAVGGGRARAYGVTLEREGPGVVWDGMALIGAFTSRFGEQDPAHIEAQIAHRDPDLLVFMFGGNDMLRERAFKDSMALYEREYGEVIASARGTDKKRACLVMSAIDHGERQGRRIVTRPIVPRMVEAQRNAALASGCAFFDTYQAMGGEGSMGRWSQMEPRLGNADLAHPTARGHKVIGNLLYRALMAGYVEYRRGMAGKAIQGE